MLNIKPEDIDRESCFGEVLATLGDHVRRDWCPLAELETKGLQGWHSKEASSLGE